MIYKIILLAGFLSFLIMFFGRKENGLLTIISALCGSVCLNFWLAEVLK